jgi:hypothetical protein
MSSKNNLQEHCQKNKLDIPKYNTVRIGGDDHNPIWQSDLTVFNKTFTAQGKTKKEAEQQVADAATKNIVNLKVTVDTSPTQYSRSQKYNSINDIKFAHYDNIVLVDAENQDLDEKITDNKKTLFIMFAAKNTSKNWVFKFQELYNNTCIFLSECVGKDAADHLLTFYLGKLSVIAPDKKYYVLTKDHYGEYLQNFCDNTKFVCSNEELQREAATQSHLKRSPIIANAVSRAQRERR